MKIIITDSHINCEAMNGYMFYPAPVAPFLILAASVEEAKKLWKEYNTSKAITIIEEFERLLNEKN